MNLGRAGRVEEPAHGGNSIGRNARASGVFLDGGLVRREIDAVDFVTGYVTLEPADLGTHFLESFDRPLSNLTPLRVG